MTYSGVIATMKAAMTAIRRNLFARLFVTTSMLMLGAAIWIASPAARAETIKIGGTGSALGTMQHLGRAFMAANPDTTVVVVPSLSSSGGIKAALAGSIDIAVSARPPKPEETSAGINMVAYARTPFIIATAKTNPTSTLTPREVADIYAGRRQAWPDGTPVRVILRPPGDSDIVGLQEMSPEVNAAVTEALARKEARGMLVALNDQEAADLLEQTPGAVGSSTLALIVSDKRPLKALAINGVVPSAKTLADGSYPYQRAFYAGSTVKPSPAAAKFMAFVRSPAGAAIIQENGQIPARD